MASAISYLIRDTMTGNYLKQQADGYIWGAGKAEACLFDLNVARKMCGQLQKAGYPSLKLITVTGGIKGAGKA